MATGLSAPDARARLAAASEALLAGVRRALPRWVEGRIEFVADAWGRLDADSRAVLDQRAAEAAATTTARVVQALRDLFATEPEQQRTTPLEIVRSATLEATQVLAAAGIPPVERDGFHERAFPDDSYGLVPDSMADLGDPELTGLGLEWGAAKAGVLRRGPRS